MPDWIPKFLTLKVSIFQTISTLAVALAFLYRKRWIADAGIPANIRAHFSNMFLAWLILGVYFLLDLGWRLTPVTIWTNVRGEVGVYSEACLQIFVCVTTNLLLRRATLQLDFYQAFADATESRNPLVGLVSGKGGPANSALRIRNIRTHLKVGNWIDPLAVYSGILGLFVILAHAGFSLVVIPAHTGLRLAVTLAHASLNLPSAETLAWVVLIPQFVFTTLLLLWLGVVYMHLESHVFLVAGAWIYGLIHFTHMFSHSPAFVGVVDHISIFFKLFYAIALLIPAALLDIPDDTVAGILKKPAFFCTRRNYRRRLHKVTARWVLAVVLALAAIAAGIFFKTSPWHVAVRISVLVIMLRIASWSIFYTYKTKATYKVRWSHHANNSMADHIQYDSVEEPGQGWNHEIIQAPDDVYQPDDSVILIHGIFGSGSRSWGLLPLVLVQRYQEVYPGRSVRVHLLSYQHGMMSFGTRLKSLPEELASKLKDIREETSGDVFVFAHSLGALLSVEACCLLLDDHQSLPDSLCLVAPPLRGSWASLPALPFLSDLYPGSKYAARIRNKLRNRLSFIREGSIATDMRMRVSFRYGIQDHVVGDIARGLGLPAVQLDPENHGTINEPYALDGKLANSYLRNLVPHSIDVGMLRLAWTALADGTMIRGAWIVHNQAEERDIDVLEVLELRNSNPISIMTPNGNKTPDMNLRQALMDWIDSLYGSLYVTRNIETINRNINDFYSLLKGSRGSMSIRPTPLTDRHKVYAIARNEYSLILVQEEVVLIDLQESEAES